MRNFKELIVWQKSMILVSECYDFCKHIPNEERYGLISQIKRSSVSIPSNIAEGSSRRSDRDYYRFLEIALGSSFELETEILIAEMKFKTPHKKLTEIKMLIEEIEKMLSSFLKRLN